MDFKDYYAILGVKPDADEKEIKTVYRRLARKYHPDLNKQADAEEQFKVVAEAYEILHQREKRAEYDELCEARKNEAAFRENQKSGSGFSSYTQSNQDFSNFFESIFGKTNNPFQDSRQKKSSYQDNLTENFSQKRKRCRS